MTDFADRRLRMVDSQIRPADITSFPLIEAFLSVPREEFVPASAREMAYADANLPLVEGRVMFEPRTLGKMLQLLAIKPTDLVLDIGCGGGYAAAILGRLAEAVVALEADEAMAAFAEKALAQEGADRVAVVTGPLAEGAAQHGPYDVIVIEGGIACLPEAIEAQLKEGGRIACLFVTGGLGTVRIGIKAEGRISWRREFDADAPVLEGFAPAPVFEL